MKVSGTGAGGVVGPSSGRARSTDSSFTLNQTSGAQASAPVARTSAATPTTSVDALLAMQQMPTATERKRKAVKRAGRILDHLDDLKLSMLDSAPTDDALDKLAVAVREARDDTTDPGLEAVLNEIETRAAVELAKREMSRKGN